LNQGNEFFILVLNKELFTDLGSSIQGDVFTDDKLKALYATDASAYREIPSAVVIPRTKSDLIRIIRFARDHKTSLIPRTAGTSLAGQVVGPGIVVDVSKHMNQILELNEKERWVSVEPGVIRDDLNVYLRKYGLFFGPETSTANRAMIGGMVGNNSCGSNSVVYKSTREHLISLKMILADGEEVEFKELSLKEFQDKVSGAACTSNLEQNIYSTINDILTDEENQKEIRSEFPKPTVTRRNTGYAIDLLMHMEPFSDKGEKFNMCRLIAGSEGTLGFITEIKLDINPLPPEHNALICIHFDSLYESLEANLIALKYHPYASELIDHYILECTKENIAQRKNRFFIQGDPQALLIVEIAKDNPDDLDKTVKQLIAELKANNYGYHYPVLKGSDVGKIWSLRKAGLGLLSNIPGDAKPVPVVEDTAVDVNDLPAYIREFNDTLKKYDLYCVHYAHAGSGELHLRPIIDLKTANGQQLFKTVLDEVARLVKKYGGSLSGEHGDGRLRGEFIPFMIGKKNYALLEKIKFSWDPDNIFNPGKIVRTPSMNTFLRYEPDQETRKVITYFDFSKTQGILRATEMCNGSGDCRKTVLSGGTMCPSYMATRNEVDTTRARANILREYLTHSPKNNPFDHNEIKEVLDLCLSCKGCKSECPSNVDMARLKAEFLQNYYDSNGIPLRSWLIGHINRINAIGIHISGIYNFFVSDNIFSSIFKKIFGFALKRSFPRLSKGSLRQWIKKNPDSLLPLPGNKKGSVYLFVDEFTDYTDLDLGISTIRLLAHLGFEVKVISHPESGRAFLSKGMVKKAKKVAKQNIMAFSGLINPENPLVGIEPSAILSFRDEYPDLVSPELKVKALELSGNVCTIEEFLAQTMQAGIIGKEDFTSEKQDIYYHAHCHQKSLSSDEFTESILSIPENFEVHEIPSGCCGMAGSFGFEKEHFQLSMEVGELVLFPAIRKTNEKSIIAAAGTSCRHQIQDGTGRMALHPVEILWKAHINNE
jgi:FAD/FMN-containing dehydrogenase/Fe-S oxidoreductase